MNTNLDRWSESSDSRLAHLMPLFGHRNWIVVADAAYPAQSNPGIETLFTGRDHAEVLGKVLAAIATSGHVRTKAYLDAELQLVSDADAPGVSALRREVLRQVEGQHTRALAHEDIIAKLDEAGKLFRVLILKSTLTIPYTSVFLELDCGYWNDEAEKRLRDLQAKQTTLTIESQ